MILVDTSVWIDHLRHAEHNLSDLLDRNCVMCIPPQRNRLMGKSIGFVDLYLLASVSLSPEASLWTKDKRLQRISRRIGSRVF